MRRRQENIKINMRLMCIDPGIRHLALGFIEFDNDLQFPTQGIDSLSLQYLCSGAKLTYWDVIDLTFGRTSVPQINLCARLVEQMDLIRDLIRTSDGIGIEHQMSSNHNSNKIVCHLLAYFQCRFPSIYIQMIMPTLKSKYLAALGRDLGIDDSKLSTYSGRKQWSVKMLSRCRELWKETEQDVVRPELGWRFELLTWKTWDDSKKKDDLADTIVMAFALWIHSKGKPIPNKPKSRLLPPKRIVSKVAPVDKSSKRVARKNLNDFLFSGSRNRKKA